MVYKIEVISEMRFGVKDSGREFAGSKFLQNQEEEVVYSNI